MKRWIEGVVWLAICWSALIVPPAEAQKPPYFCQDPGRCDDGLFCNGVETCAGSTCLAGREPCPGRACDEQLDLCLPGQSPKLEGGWADVGPEPEVVLLANSYQRPVVVAAVHYSPSDPPLVVRVRQVNASRLELYLQSPSNGRFSSRRVSYLVVEEGAWEIDGQRFEAQRFNSTLTDPEGRLVGVPRSFLQSYKKPAVVGQVMSERDSGWSVFWAGAQDSSRAPDWNSLRSGKTTGADPDPSREEEILGFVVFESGRSRIGATELEAGVTGPVVTGMGDGTPYIHTFSEALRSPPEIALASVAGLSDPDVGWAVVIAAGRDELDAVGTARSIQLSIDEDQLGDPERSHGAERVSYLVFDRPFSYQKTPIPSSLTYPGGSEYYYCSLDQSDLDAACSASMPAIQQDIQTCEQTIESCASGWSATGACASCLAPIPNWKKTPGLALLACLGSCGSALTNFLECRTQANAALRTAVDLDICAACSGPDCGDRYGIEIAASGLRCDEAVLATVKCQGDLLPQTLTVDHRNPGNTLPGWCPFPERWEVDVSPVLDIGSLPFTTKRECTPTHREGPPGLLNNVQASFNCTCSGADCGDSQLVPLVAEVACMPVNSYFRLETTVTNNCGSEDRTVRVDYSSPPVTTFPIGLSAKPGDQISSLVVEDTQDAPCFIEGDIDTTIPENHSGGTFSVARVRCRDDAGTGGCDQVTLSGSVSGNGMNIRPDGVTVELSIGTSSESKKFTAAIGYFETTGIPGQIFNISLADPDYIDFATGERSRCSLSSPASGPIPQGGNSVEIASIHCSLEVIVPPPQPDLGGSDPFFWGIFEGCDYVCDPNPPGGGGGGLQPCDPCTYCKDPVTNTCPSECLCEAVNVPGGNCRLECVAFLTFSPHLSVTAGAAPSTAQELRADDVLKVSASASDPNGLQGFILGVDGQYADHVLTGGTTGSFTDLAIDTSNLAPGAHTLRVIALDDHATAPTPAYVDLPFEVDHAVDPCLGDSTLPSVNITAPSQGASLNPGMIQIQVQASDAGSGVKFVKFWIDGQYQGMDNTYPYRWNWTATPGTRTIKALASDHCDNLRQTEIAVHVIDPCAGQPAPTVEITNYQDDQWVDPALFHFEADAQDFSGTGIDRVEFEVASFSNVAVDSTPPYVSTGWYLLSERDETITARAFDGCGRMASETITLHVNANSSVCEIDENHPWAGVSTPAEGALLPAGPVTVRADAADDGLLLAAVLEVDGALVPNSTILSSNPASYIWSWDATPGPHVIRIKVADVCFKIGWSLPRTVTVQ